MRTIVFLLSFILFSCASTSNNTQSSFRVIDRAAGFNDQPSWIAGKNFLVEKDKIFIKSFVTMEANTRPDACIGAASTQGMGIIAQHTSTQIMESSGVASDANNIVVERVTNALAKQKMSNIEVTEDYWQVVEREYDGQKKSRMECWARLGISKAALDMAIKRALADAAKDPEVMKLKSKLDAGQELLMREASNGH